MPPSNKTTRTRHLRKRILCLLADLYLFPQSDRGIAAALKESLPGLDAGKVRDCFAYLEKKGYVAANRSRSGAVTARITASGLDVVEGAVSDRGILPASPDLAALAGKRQIRRAILAYCRQFPDSFNADDEIHHELKEMGMAGVIIEQARLHIWYLDGKGLLEMRTSPLSGDLVFLARITAKGMDLLEGNASDPGVAGDE
ncbi:MAG: hypothetical protein ACNS63_10885 [Candidatus Nitrospinota bacterium M3_3B_026]